MADTNVTPPQKFTVKTADGTVKDLSFEDAQKELQLLEGTREKMRQASALQKELEEERLELSTKSKFHDSLMQGIRSGDTSLIRAAFRATNQLPDAAIEAMLGGAQQTSTTTDEDDEDDSKSSKLDPKIAQHESILAQLVPIVKQLNDSYQHAQENARRNTEVTSVMGLVHQALDSDQELATILTASSDFQRKAIEEEAYKLVGRRKQEFGSLGPRAIQAAIADLKTWTTQMGIQPKGKTEAKRTTPASDEERFTRLLGVPSLGPASTPVRSAHPKDLSSLDFVEKKGLDEPDFGAQLGELLAALSAFDGS